MNDFVHSIKKNQYVFCRAKLDMKWYKTKVINIKRTKGNDFVFHVHYFGWKNSFDEWFTTAEAKDCFLEYSEETARALQIRAIETLDLPLESYLMAKLGFPKAPSAEIFVEFLKEHPEALESFYLKEQQQYVECRTLCCIPTHNITVDSDILHPTVEFSVSSIEKAASKFSKKLSQFVDKDVSYAEANIFVKFPVRFNVTDILEEYVQNFKKDKLENRQKLFDHAYDLFYECVLSQLVTFSEIPYILTIVNVARRGQGLEPYTDLNAAVPFDFDIFGYTYLCRFVKFVFIYYEYYEEDENDVEFKQLINSYSLFSKYLQQSRSKWFDENLDYIRIDD